MSNDSATRLLWQALEAAVTKSQNAFPRKATSFVSVPLMAAYLMMLPASLVCAQQGAMARLQPITQASSVSMVAGDFDEDGVTDLVIGSALEQGGAIRVMRGNLDAIAPQSHASWLAAGRHEATTPFLEAAGGIRLRQVPELMAAADVNGDGHLDVIYASRSGNVIEALMGTGKGTFLANGVSIRVPGNVTALAAYRPGGAFSGKVVLAGYESKQGTGLAVVSFGAAGARVVATYPMPGAVTALAVANLDEDRIPDTAIVAGGQLLVMHGQNALQGRGRVEALPVEGAQAVTTGEFLFDRHGLTQLAVLKSNGDVQILAHAGLDSRPFTPQEIAGTRHMRKGQPTLAELAGNIAGAPWTVVETHSGVAPHGGSGTPILLRTRMSGSGGDDVVVLDGSQQQRVTISHRGASAKAPASAVVRTAPGNFGGSGELVGAVSVRVSADGRPGLATLAKGSAKPEFTVPSAGNTFSVNTTADNSGSTDADDGTRCGIGSTETCTLRDAVTFANADAADNIAGSSSDTILVPAGTYPLTFLAGSTDSNANAETHLEILGPVTIVGDTTAPGVTINGESNDVVFTINPGPYGSFNPGGNSYVFDTAMENITITGGVNPDNLANNGNANDVGGGINWDAYGTGNLTLTSVTISNCEVEFGSGGGLWVENSVGSGAGTATLTQSLISGNSTAESGGGIYVAYPYATISATNTTITGNTAAPSVNTGDPGGFGAGGGLYFGARTSTSASPQSVLTAVGISLNSAAQEGAGIYTNSGILMTGSVVTGNSSSNRGGGVYAEESSEETTTQITSTTIVNNSATTTGGGVYVGDDNPASNVPSVTMNLNNVFANTSGGTSGLALSGVGKATATDNWWGCNGGPSTPGCDAADSGATTNPWAVLTLMGSATSVLEGNPLTLTAAIDTDSNGGAIAGAFPAVNGDTVSFSVADVTSNPSQTGIPFNTAGVATATVTPSEGGQGSASATFDNQTVTFNFTADAPATMISPTPNTVLPAFSATFSWTNGTGGAGYWLFLGTTGVGSKDLYDSGETSSNAVTVNVLPTNGETIYARLFTSINGVLVHVDYLYTAAARAVLTTPAPLSTLPGPSATFSWTAGTGAAGYWLFLGTTGVGSKDLYDSGETSATSVTFKSLPTNGVTVYARLWTSFAGSLVSYDYTYTAATQAVLTTPTPGSTLAGPSATFNWTSGTGAAGYWLFLGTTGVGSKNLYDSGETSATSVTFSNLPTNGQTIYARLWTSLGGVLVSLDYTYTAAPAKAAMLSPTPGTTLPGPGATFNWTGVNGAAGYWLFLGTTGVGTKDLYDSGETTATSVTFNSLPLSGVKVYARVYTSVNGSLVYNDYTYTAAAQAMLTTPTPGTTLAGASVTFDWSAATGTGVQGYWLFLGTTGVGSKNLYDSGETTALTETVNNLPTTGGLVYARVYTSYNGTLKYLDYTYTAK